MVVIEQCQGTINEMIVKLQYLKQLYKTEGLLHEKKELTSSIIDLHSEIPENQKNLTYF
jgi:hypothetical protein